MEEKTEKIITSYVDGIFEISVIFLPIYVDETFDNDDSHTQAHAPKCFCQFQNYS